MERQQWRKNGKTGENPSMEADESLKQEVTKEARNKGRKGSFCVIDGSLSSWEFGAGTSVSKVQRPSCSPRWHCKRWFWFVCSVHWARIICITNDGCKSDGRHVKATRIFRTSSGCSICLHPGQNGRCTKIIENSQSQNVQTFGYVCRNTNGRQSWSSLEDPVVPLEQNLYGHPLAGLLWERQFEKVLLENGWEKVSNWKCWFVHREKGLFLSMHVDDIKLAGNESRTVSPTRGKIHEWRWCGRTNIIPWPCLFGLHSTRMQNKPKMLWTITGICLNPGRQLGGIENYLIQRNLKQTFFHGPMTWKVTQISAGLLCERQFEKVLLGPGWEKGLICERLFVNRASGLSVYVDDIKLAGKTKTENRLGKFSCKTLIWENQHHSLTHV